MITQQHYDDLKPGDRFIDNHRRECLVISRYDGDLWAHMNEWARPFRIDEIDAIISPAPVPVSFVNLYADGTVDSYGTRHGADKYADLNRTHVITIYGDGTTTTEVVS